MNRQNLDFIFSLELDTQVSHIGVVTDFKSLCNILEATESLIQTPLTIHTNKVVPSSFSIQIK